MALCCLELLQTVSLTAVLLKSPSARILSVSLVLAGLTACSGSTQRTGAQGVAGEAPLEYFVEDPIELLPALDAAAALNIDVLRREKTFFNRMAKLAREQAADAAQEKDAKGENGKLFLEQINYALDNIQTVILGFSMTEDDPQVVMVIRGGTAGNSLLDFYKKSGEKPLKVSKDGFPRGSTDEGDEIVFVDDYTVVFMEQGLAPRINGMLAGKQQQGLKDTQAYRSLSKEAGFHTATASLIGAFDPNSLAQMDAKLSPKARPFVKVLKKVNSFGLRVDLGNQAKFRLVANTASAKDASKLAGMLELFKEMAMEQLNNPLGQELISKLVIEGQNAVVRIFFELSQKQTQDIIKEFEDHAQKAREEKKLKQPKKGAEPTPEAEIQKPGSI